jgi:hypothetical protein
MRGSIIVLAVIVAALGIVVFLAGWIQLALGPDTYGVLSSRPRGIESAVASPSGFTWRWQRLVPGLFTIYRFPLTSQKAELTVKGSLPSGEVYSSLSPEKPDFGYELEVSVLYRLRPGALPGLAETARLRPDGLDDLYGLLADQMRTSLHGLVMEAEPRDAGELSAAVSERLPRHFPQVEFALVAPSVIRMPDMTLYGRMRDTYLEVTRAREDALKGAAARLATADAEQRAAEQRHERSLVLLEKYGALLDRHPQLIKFLFLAAAKGFSPQDIQTLDLLGKLEALR